MTSRVAIVSKLDKLEYWQMNTPFPPATCPEFLQNLSAKNIRILQTADADFKPLTWQEVKNAIANEDLNIFWRVPSEQRRYLEFCWLQKRKWGSITAFVLEERLHWRHIDTSREISLSGQRFENPKNVAVKKNDWPYGIDKRITHLVVWTTFALREEATTGRLTETGKLELEQYVDRVFRIRVPNHDVSYFRIGTGASAEFAHTGHMVSKLARVAECRRDRSFPRPSI
jgi:Protein of unknown function (DUF3605)